MRVSVGACELVLVAVRLAAQLVAVSVATCCWLSSWCQMSSTWPVSLNSAFLVTTRKAPFRCELCVPGEETEARRGHMGSEKDPNQNSESAVLGDRPAGFAEDHPSSSTKRSESGNLSLPGKPGWWPCRPGLNALAPILRPPVPLLGSGACWCSQPPPALTRLPLQLPLLPRSLAGRVWLLPAGLSVPLTGGPWATPHQASLFLFA